MRPEEIEKQLKSQYCESFFREKYLDSLGGDDCSFERYLKDALCRGYMPCEQVDPIYLKLKCKLSWWRRLLIRVKSWMRSGRGRSRSGLPSLYPNIKARSCHMVLPFNSKHWDLARLNVDNIISNIPGQIKFDVNGESYEMLIPSFSDFERRLNHNTPFAFVRLPHGFWDALLTLDRVSELVASNPISRCLNEKEIRTASIRLLADAIPSNGTFLEGVLDGIEKNLRSRPSSENFLVSVAFKGFPTFDDTIFPHSDCEELGHEWKDKLAEYFSSDRDKIYDATIWKRWILSGDIFNLPACLEEHPVILVGPDRLSKINDKWQLSQFEHIVIPLEKTHEIKDSILIALRKSIHNAKSSKPKKQPVVLFQCGGSLSFWFICNLYRHDHDAYYIDMGQALDVWCFGDVDPLGMPWLRLFSHDINKKIGQHAGECT